MKRSEVRAAARYLAGNLRAKRRTFRASDGTQLSFEAWGPADDPRPVVLCHGFAVDTRVNWVATGIVERLVREGHRVVGLDARGHGRSDAPHDPARYGEDRMAADVATLLDVLEAPAVSVVGYSMGAVVAAVVAITDARVERLVLGGVGAGLVDHGGLDTDAVSNEAVADALEADGGAPDPATAGFRMLADAVGADRWALAAAARAARQGPLALERITAETLVLAGDADPLAHDPARLAAAIAGARVALVDGDHLGAVTQPAFADALAEFVAGRPPGGTR